MEVPMLKRFFIIILCLGFALCMSTRSFTQDNPMGAEDKKIDTTAKDTAPAEDKKIDTTAKDTAPAEDKKIDTTAKDTAPAVPTKLALTAIQAKTFFDGINTYANSKVLIKLNSKDNILLDKVEYKINNGELKLYANPFSIADEGKYSIVYFGTDKIGNKEDEKYFKVIIDNTPPAIAVMTSKPLLKIGEKLFGSKSINFTINTKDALSGVDKTEYSQNGKDYTEYVTSFNILSDGEIELKARSIDNVSNSTDVFTLKINDETGKEIELKESSVKIFMDNVLPVVSIKADKEFVIKDNKNIASSQYKYTVAATDNESGVAQILVRIDGKGDFAPYKDQLMFATNGEHLIEAKAIDKTGNVSTVAILSVFVDVIPPQSTIETVTEK
jgi:hypothetical protein